MTRHPLASLSVRTRVILAVVALTALALFFSGTVVVLWGQTKVDQRIGAEHQAVVASLRQLASENDPVTGTGWAGPDDLLRVAIQRSVLAPGEGAFALINQTIAWTAQPGVTLRPEEDDELVATVIPLSGLGVVTYGRVTTARHDWAYVVAPIGFDGQTAALVRVADLGEERAQLTPVYAAYGLVGLGSLVLVALMGWLVVGRLLRPVTEVRTTAQRITATDISQRIPVTGHDDLAELAATVNSMLDRLETAVNGQRQLLDDVGHELRTPLTIARGHLELVDAADPGDVQATRGLVLSEMDRMSRLVDDLLALSRGQQADLLRPGETDIVELTDQTLTKATGLGERQWQLDAVAEVTAWLDAQRVSQAWLQLAANAVQYSEPGTVVGLGSAVDGDELRLWVRDEGQGIDPADRERIFERSTRGSTGEGTGLGLAIVSAISASHGGRVDVSSTLGGGSTFTIVVPLRGQP
ncbi:MAG: HAMP domain-containing histidine kinase [Propionibacteriaceae bacterium]|nr:HAMP domain-containing histidine kinase [Propionibacteriaceae bacterium]